MSKASTVPSQISINGDRTSLSHTFKYLLGKFLLNFSSHILFVWWECNGKSFRQKEIWVLFKQISSDFVGFIHFLHFKANKPKWNLLSHCTRTDLFYLCFFWRLATQFLSRGIPFIFNLWIVRHLTEEDYAVTFLYQLFVSQHKFFLVIWIYFNCLVQNLFPLIEKYRGYVWNKWITRHWNLLISLSFYT